MISGPIRYCKRLAPEALKRPIRKWMHARWHAKAARAQIAYYEAREQEIRRVLGSPAILQTFLKSEALPKNYGRGLDERIVEYPWLMSRLGNRSSKLLDLGSTLNHEYVLERIGLPDREVSIATLEPEIFCFWQKRVNYVFCDARELPFRENYFDEVACISTLEHVGCDNTRYYSANPAYKERSPDAFLDVVREIYRVLKPGGTFYLTVPFGKAINYGWFQQFDVSMLNQLSAAWGSKPVSETYFLYHSGWHISSVNECSGATSFHDVPRPLDGDQPIASMSIAALQFTKLGRT